MATIEVQGYVQRPQAKKSGGGREYTEFGLGVKQKQKAYKDKPESVTWANFNIKDFSTGTPLPEKTYVRVTGYLTVREYEKDGQKRTALDIVAKEVVDLSDNGGGKAAESTAKPAAAPAKDDFDDLPF